MFYLNGEFSSLSLGLHHPSESPFSQLPGHPVPAHLFPDPEVVVSALEGGELGVGGVVRGGGEVGLGGGAAAEGRLAPVLVAEWGQGYMGWVCAMWKGCTVMGGNFICN